MAAAANTLDDALIAIVDDDESLREAIGSLLRSTGYRTLGFRSAEELLTRLRSISAACLIVDVRLPGMSGLDLQWHLAATGVRIPIVVVTAQPDREGHLRRQALGAGALALLHKPFTEKDLLGVVEVACGRASKSATQGQDPVQRLRPTTP